VRAVISLGEPVRIGEREVTCILEAVRTNRPWLGPDPELELVLSSTQVPGGLVASSSRSGSGLQAFLFEVVLRDWGAGEPPALPAQLEFQSVPPQVQQTLVGK
jgi:hypothetical protein